MTNVAPDGRITPGCTGLWNDAQQQAWADIVAFVHGHSAAKIGVQLGHAGRRGAVQPPWVGAEVPLPPAEAWPLLAPSALPFHPGMPTPKAMDRDDMDRVTAAFVAATVRARVAGFDACELHCAHGYLLSTFLSPLTNRRTDEYGGELEGRLRYPLEVLRAMREQWPRDRVLAVRISACDWAPGGHDDDGDAAVAMARAFAAAGADVIDVSSAGLVPEQQPDYGRMWQVPFADRIRHEVGVPVIAVGGIEGWDHINTVIAAGRADLCALARPHLLDPQLTLRAAVEQHVTAAPWPTPYHIAAPRPARPPAGEPLGD
jgi:anthraniloyl-CoA monooxygenase